MWNLVRMYFLSRMLGGKRTGSPSGRRGCGCFTLLLVLAAVLFLLYLLGLFGQHATSRTGW